MVNTQGPGDSSADVRMGQPERGWGGRRRERSRASEEMILIKTYERHGREEKRPRRYTELERQSSNYRGDAVEIRRRGENLECLRMEEEKFKIKAEAVAACLVV